MDIPVKISTYSSLELVGEISNRKRKVNPAPSVGPFNNKTLRIMENPNTKRDSLDPYCSSSDLKIKIREKIKQINNNTSNMPSPASIKSTCLYNRSPDTARPYAPSLLPSNPVLRHTACRIFAATSAVPAYSRCPDRTDRLPVHSAVPAAP